MQIILGCPRNSKEISAFVFGRIHMQHLEAGFASSSSGGGQLLRRLEADAAGAESFRVPSSRCTRTLNRMGRAEEEATVAQEEAATEAEETEAGAAEVAVTSSSENKAAAAALRANILCQKPKVPTTVPSASAQRSGGEALPAAVSGNAAAAAAGSQAVNPAAIDPVANNPNLHRNSGKHSLPPRGKYPLTSRTLDPSAPNTVSHIPQTLNHNPLNTCNPNTPTPNIRRQPPFQSLSALQAKRQAFQRPQPHFTTPPKRVIQPRQPPGWPHQPPLLNLATNEEAHPNQSQPGQQADFEYDTNYHPARNNNFTGNFSHPQVGYGHDYMPSQHADYLEFDPPGFRDESLSSQYDDFSETVPNYSCGVPAPVVGTAAMASYGAARETVLGQKRKFSGPSLAGARPTHRPFTRGPDPPVGPAQAPEYPINGHTGELGVHEDYDAGEGAHNPQGETYMERRMQWALHRLHTLEERMLQIETAGGAYNGV
ncbi:hypothetical protein WJX77_000127 [Trebouxia sp. C0004]